MLSRTVEDMAEPIVPQEPIRFPAEDGVSLEGELRHPVGRALRGSAVLCHPDPKQGGSKDHPLLWAVRNDLAGRGFAVLAFNFRGVMGSSGTWGGGHAEVRDVAGAIARVRAEVPGPTLLAGWSFGANVALRAALHHDDVHALALLAVPLGEREGGYPALPDTTALRALRRPTLLLAGANDAICPVADLRALGARIPGARVEIVDGTNHFFWRRERDAAELVGAFAESALFPEPAESQP